MKKSSNYTDSKTSPEIS